MVAQLFKEKENMDIDFMVLLPFILMGVAVGIAYSIYNYVTKTTPGEFETKRFVASVIFGAIIGAIGGYTASSSGSTPEDVEWWGMMGGLFLAYSGAQLYINRFIDAIWVYIYGTKMGMGNFGSTVHIYPVSPLAAGVRKMTDESRRFLIFDLPQWAQMPTLTCVDQAESKDPVTYRYAIKSLGWIFIIENGQLTGSKHYWISFSSKIEWKPISYDTLEKIRQTGRFPDYGYLT